MASLSRKKRYSQQAESAITTAQHRTNQEDASEYCTSARKTNKVPNTTYHT